MIWVVEPHADDAFLSLGQHIENWVHKGLRVGILTVYSGTRKRGEEAQTYAKAVGALWRGLGLIEAGVAQGGKAQSLSTSALRKFFRTPSLIREPWRVIGPVGLVHPEHLEVRKCLPAGSQLYLDAPRFLAQKNSALVTQTIRNMRIVSYVKPPIRKWRHIPIFKDQAKFFHFNPPERLKEGFELILRTP